MAINKLNPSAGGVPYGDNAKRPANPGIGRLYSNGEEKRLELYTDTGWQNIVSETPGVVSISGNYLESNATNSIDITGTNFTTGAIASAIGTNGVEVNASSTTVNSIVSVTAVFSGLSSAYEPYDIKITNTSNLFGLLPDALYINQSPIWITSSGSLGSYTENVSITLSALSATDPESQTITYSLTEGSSLPVGLSLNSSTGVISGSMALVNTDTTYSFSISASDGSNSIPRSFSITNVNSITVQSVEYLVVAGGGGGGADGGYGSGGGAGGYRYGSLTPSGGVQYSVVVGLGGNGQVGAGADNSTFGGASTFAAITSAGGARGRGVGGGVVGLAGGSGSGGDRNPGGAGNTPATTPAQGYAGGNGGTESTGGGGGAGGVGGNGGNSVGGSGGPGAQSSITGVATYYAGGGGGASMGTGGSGGSGIGGNAGNAGQPGTAGAANTGSGGGGGGAGYATGANGGSGVVIIAYQNISNYIEPTISAGLTYTLSTTSRAGYRVYRFTAGTGTITF